MRQHHVIIDRDKCVGCSRCASVCVANNIVIKNKKAETVLDDCLMCGQCSAVCPKKAITVSGYHTDQKEKQGDIRLDPREVLEVIRFRRSIRRFKQEPVPNEVIDQILEAGTLTNTAKTCRTYPSPCWKRKRPRSFRC